MRAVAKVHFKYRLQQHFETLLDRAVLYGWYAQWSCLAIGPWNVDAAYRHRPVYPRLQFPSPLRNQRNIDIEGSLSINSRCLTAFVALDVFPCLH